MGLARKYKDVLRNKLNIEVVSVNQPVIDSSDPSAFMMEGVNELFDEYYLHQLRFGRAWASCVRRLCWLSKRRSRASW